MQEFKANLELIGINPFIFVPNEILEYIFRASGMNKGHIPIKGAINQTPYKQTLVKYSGAWRLYINTKMLKNSPQRIGELILLTIEYDPDDRKIEPHKLLVLALAENPIAKTVFENLTTSKQQEIIRYISRLKTEESVIKNVQRAINFLNGIERFLGRDKP
jgi:hypothetical protein